MPDDATIAQHADPHNHLPIGSLDGLDSYGDGIALDPGIRHYVLILRSQGVETCQSCEGGCGHSYPEPTVEFFGGKAEGLRALASALAYGLPVAELRRAWTVQDGELDRPVWQLIFVEKADAHLARVAAKETAWAAKKDGWQGRGAAAGSPGHGVKPSPTNA